MLGFLRKNRTYLVAAYCNAGENQTVEVGHMKTRSRGTDLLNEAEKGLAQRIYDRNPETKQQNKPLNIHVFNINPLN